MSEPPGPSVDGKDANELGSPSTPSAGANVAPKSTADLLREWKLEAETRAIAQQMAAVGEAKNNRILGVAATAFAAIGGTSAFASLLASDDPVVVLVAGLFTITAAALSAIQTYLGLGESSGAHRSASAGFLGLESRLEVAIVLHAEGQDVTRKELEQFAKEFEDLEKGTRLVSKAIYDKAEAEAKDRARGGLPS